MKIEELPNCVRIHTVKSCSVAKPLVAFPEDGLVARGFFSVCNPADFCCKGTTTMKKIFFAAALAFATAQAYAAQLPGAAVVTNFSEKTTIDGLERCATYMGRKWSQTSDSMTISDDADVTKLTFEGNSTSMTITSVWIKIAGDNQGYFWPVDDYLDTIDTWCWNQAREPENGGGLEEWEVEEDFSR